MKLHLAGRGRLVPRNLSLAFYLTSVQEKDQKSSLPQDFWTHIPKERKRRKGGTKAKNRRQIEEEEQDDDENDEEVEENDEDDE